MTVLVYLLLWVGMIAITPVVFALAFVVSTAIGFATSAAAAVRCLTPSAPVAHLRLSPTRDQDPAQHAYLAGPVLRDLRWMAHTALRAARNRLVALPNPDPETEPVDSLLAWLRAHKRALIEDERAWTVPIAGVTAGLLAGFAAAVLLIAAIVAVHTVLVTSVILAVRAAGSGLRCFEVAALTLRGISTECGRCHQRLTRPVFLCRGCGKAHSNLVPGGQGVLRRTCECGYRLPTLLVTGKRTLPAQCGLCGHTLPGPAQLDRTTHLPVVGAMAAGKSVFMHTAVARLHQERDLEPADYTTRERLAQARGLLRTDTPLPPTPVGQPVAYTIRIGSNPHRRLVHLYDASGEILERAEHLAESAFLGLTGGVLLVVDPFSLPAVSSRADLPTLRAARASLTDPKTVLDGLVETLTETRGTQLPVCLAVVITKGDALLTVTALPHPYAGVVPAPLARSAAARQWLIDQGRIDVVNSAHNHFPEVRYFVVTYRDAEQVLPRHPGNGSDPVTHDDPAAPILWLLDR